MVRSREIGSSSAPEEFGPRARPIPRWLCRTPPRRRAPRERLVQLQGATSGRAAERERLRGRKEIVGAEGVVRLGEPRVRRRVAGIPVDRLLEVLDPPADAVRGTPVPVVPAPEIRLDARGSTRLSRTSRASTCGSIRTRISPAIEARDLALERQHVPQVALVAPRQRWRSVAASISCAVMRTRSPARATVPSTTASTWSARAISGSGFLAPLNCMADVRETTRRSRDLREVRDQRFGHAVREVFLLRITREVDERQDASDRIRPVRGSRAQRPRRPDSVSRSVPPESASRETRRSRSTIAPALAGRRAGSFSSSSMTSAASPG